MDGPDVANSCTYLPPSKVLPERSTEMLRNTILEIKVISSKPAVYILINFSRIKFQSVVVGLETIRRPSNAQL